MPPEDSNLEADAIARGDLVPEEAAIVEADTAAADAAAAETQRAADQAAIDADAEAAAAAPAPAPDDHDSPKGNMIPQTRFNEAVGKERGRAETAEAELQKYRARDAQQQQAANFEQSQAKVKEMLKQHSSLLADGELDRASEVMGDVLQLRDDMQNARMDRQADNARNSAKAEVQYDATVARLEADYPEINPDSDLFDQSAVRQVQMMVTGIMQSEGKSPSQALMEATNILLKPQKDAKGLREKPSEEVVAAGMRRTQQQIDKNIRTSNAQPPTTGGVGADHDKTGGVLDAAALDAMSFDDFMNVPDAELAKMRGDFIQ